MDHAQQYQTWQVAFWQRFLDARRSRTDMVEFPALGLAATSAATAKQTNVHA
jgi:hypothetical protein